MEKLHLHTYNYLTEIWHTQHGKYSPSELLLILSDWVNHRKRIGMFRSRGTINIVGGHFPPMGPVGVYKNKNEV